MYLKYNISTGFTWKYIVIRKIFCMTPRRGFDFSKISILLIVFFKSFRPVFMVELHINSPLTGQRQTLTFDMICLIFIAKRTSCLEKSAHAWKTAEPVFQWIFLHSSGPLNLLLVRCHQVEIIPVKRLTQERNNVTRMRFEPRSRNLGRRKKRRFYSLILAAFVCILQHQHYLLQSLIILMEIGNS